jgi:hypothetical protein
MRNVDLRVATPRGEHEVVGLLGLALLALSVIRRPFDIAFADRGAQLPNLRAAWLRLHETLR